MKLNNMCNIALIYLACMVVHYGFVHLYQYSCTPSTFKGFVMSPLMASSPHCKGMRWIIYEMGEKIDIMWISIGVTSVMHINKAFNKN
jgi:hypothetical protein